LLCKWGNCSNSRQRSKQLHCASEPLQFKGLCLNPVLSSSSLCSFIIVLTLLSFLFRQLVREITINDGRGNRTNFYKIMSEARYEGCPPGDSRSRAVPLLLMSKTNHHIKPSTKSGLVECKYHVLIEMDIPWAPDIEIPSPVTIYMPLSAAWAGWAPPAWASHCVTQQVHPALRVPDHILHERVQNGFFVATHTQLPYEIRVDSSGDVNLNIGVGEKSPLLRG
jgi:hypothetical protein